MPFGSGVVRAGFAAHAKLNLGLRVLGRRDDGYHEVDTTMVRVDLADELTVSAGSGADTLTRVAAGDPTVDASSLPLGDENLVLRAVRAYRIAAGAAGPPPLTVGLLKRVPLAAGLGGGSSDAASMLRWLAATYPAAVDIVALAVTLGSDVPFFASGWPAARARGRGEQLVPARVDPFTAVLVNPGVSVSAAAAYGWWRPEPGRAGSPADAGSGLRPSDQELRNDLERGVAERVPAVAEALGRLRDAGAGPVAMSGSGATCFAVVEESLAASVAAELAGARPSWWVRVVRGPMTAVSRQE
jgi:4-diphosphocytidyl-2-C-methyl-D-erythritol kinase